jgi:hypothetical protein
VNPIPKVICALFPFNSAFLEYRELVEEGRRLREEWAQTNEQLRDTKPPQDQNHPDYDISVSFEILTAPRKLCNFLKLRHARSN